MRVQVETRVLAWVHETWTVEVPDGTDLASCDEGFWLDLVENDEATNYVGQEPGDDAEGSDRYFTSAREVS